MYDPALGRFHSIDPLAEVYNSWTPCQYALNNPIRFIDKDGNLVGDPLKTNQYRGWYGDNWAPSGSKFGLVRKYDAELKKNTRYHQGVDLYAKPGTEVKSMYKGTVVLVNNETEHKDFGKQVIIKCTVKGKDGKDKTYYIRYSHLKEVTVSKDGEVNEGDKVGTTGKTGNAKNLKDKEAHLHLEFMDKLTPGTGKTGNDNRTDPDDFIDIDDASKDDQKEETSSSSSDSSSSSSSTTSSDKKKEDENK